MAGLAIVAALSGGSFLPAQASESGQTLLYVRPQPSGPPGSEVVLVGFGFDEDKPIEVRWASADGRQVGAAVGPDFSLSIAIPQVDPGLYSLVAVSRGANGELGTAARADFLVTATGSSAPADKLDPTSTVAAPGSAEAASRTSPYLVVALACVLLALAFVAFRGRPRRATVD